MIPNDITLYIDISEFLHTRKTTGIQRVIREFLSRVIKTQKVYLLDIDKKKSTFLLINNNEITPFLEDIPHYTFKQLNPINLDEQKEKNKVFLEIDTVWNSHFKRKELYPKLKKNDFKIYNLVYDLIPLLFPHYLYAQSQKNFPDFIKSVYAYSDAVILNSDSAKNDFAQLKKRYSCKRDIPTHTIPLGANFSKKVQTKPSKYEEIFKKRFILFVGTIEPRKKQLQLLEVYEELYTKNPDIHLVFIGKLGWGVDKFVQKYMSHPLKRKTIHHLTNIDDDTLSLFYQNAFLVTYLSHYEGFGLPLVESLSYHNITIISNNSSLSEFEKNYVDFVKNDSNQALQELLEYYISNSHIYHRRKEEIRKSYKITTWEDFHLNLLRIIETFAILHP